MIEEIYGQGVTFDANTCDGFCMPLYGAGACGDNCGDDYISNSLFEGDPLDGWTFTAGAQLVEKVFITDLSSELTLTQSVSIPADDYIIFYSFNCSIDFDLELTITNGPTAEVLFDTASGDESIGYSSITLTGGDSRTITLDFTSVLPNRSVIPGYVYICPKEAYTPYTDFQFQLPIVETGDNLLDDASSNSGIVPIQGSLSGSDTGTLSVSDTPVSCPSTRTDTFFNGHISVPSGENGRYWIEYEIASGSIAYSYDGDIPNAVEIEFGIRNGGGSGTQTVTGETLSGALRTSVCTPTGTDFFDVDINADIISYDGTCRVEYELDDLDSTAYKMWYEDSATLEDDTQYRLKFTNKNSTSTTVEISDENGTNIFSSSSNGVLFDKVFQTGTLPGGKTVVVRFVFDYFIDTDTSGWEDSILTSAELYKQCSYTVEVQDSTETALFDLTEVQGGRVETVGNSYAPTIEYTLDTNSLSADTYSLVVYDDCDTNDQGQRSNYFNICNGLIGYSQISWTPSNNKTVGDYTLDYTNYPTTKFLWIKCDIQDLDIQNERTAYVQSDGFVNVPYSRARNLYTLVIHPLPRHMREALSFAFQDTFYIDGVAYQVIDEDAYSPLFTARYDNAIRVPVHKVGAFSTSRNA